MLTFRFIASRQGFQVDSYEDEAIGAMSKNEKGVPWVSSVALTPKKEDSTRKRQVFNRR